MRKLMMTLSALALGAGAAHAGGMTVPQDPVIAAPQPVMATAYDWTGGYVGLGLSYGRAEHNTDTSPEFWPNGSGFGLGGLAGYNWQSGNTVFGVEAHLSAHRMRGTTDAAGPDEVRTDLRSVSSLRGRIGITQDRTLFFLTAGPAIGNVRHTAVNPDLQESNTANGVMIGVGIEQALQDGWHIRGDVEHYRFRSQDFDTAGPGSFPGVRTRANIARVSAVFRF